MDTVEFTIYVKERSIPVRKSVLFVMGATPIKIGTEARELATRGFFHSFSEKHKAFISPNAIHEVHWDYKETDEG